MSKHKTYDVLPINIEVNSELKSINFYLLKTDDSLILVDAGLSRNNFYGALLQTLQANGLSLQDITEIVLTHNHGDHVGLVNRITKKHQVPVYVHPDAFPRLKRNPEFFEMRVHFFAELYDKMGAGDAGRKQVAYLREAIIRNQNQSIQADLTPMKESFGDFSVIHTPGHAPDHIVLYHEVAEELFAGDLLIRHISSNALVEPDENGNQLKTLIQQKQSLEKINELTISTTYSGHGEIIQNTQQLIEHRLKGIDNKANKFKNILSESGRLTAAELAQNYYGNLYQKQFSLVMSEIIGHLDYLEEAKRVIKEKENGVYYYTAID